jgi:hypothetical protein
MEPLTWGLVITQAVTGILVWIAYRLGRQHGRADTVAHYDKLLRIEPLDRPQGVPTNVESPPSRVSRGRIVKRPRWNP